MEPDSGELVDQDSAQQGRPTVLSALERKRKQVTGLKEGGNKRLRLDTETNRIVAVGGPPAKNPKDICPSMFVSFDFKGKDSDKEGLVEPLYFRNELEKAEYLNKLKQEEDAKAENKREKQRQRQRRYRQNLKIRAAQEKIRQQQIQETLDKRMEERETRKQPMGQMLGRAPQQAYPQQPHLQQPQHQLPLLPQQKSKPQSQLQLQLPPQLQLHILQQPQQQYYQRVIQHSPAPQVNPRLDSRNMPQKQTETEDVDKMLPSLKELIGELSLADSPPSLHRSSTGPFAFKARLSTGPSRAPPLSMSQQSQSQQSRPSNTSPRLPSPSLRGNAGKSSPRSMSSSRGSPIFSSRTSSASPSPVSSPLSSPRHAGQPNSNFAPPSLIRSSLSEGSSIDSFSAPFNQRISGSSSTPTLLPLPEETQYSLLPPTRYSQRSPLHAQHSDAGATSQINPTSLYSPMLATNFPLLVDPSSRRSSPRISAGESYSSSELTPCSSSDTNVSYLI